jgi:hypothetical protein
MKRIDFVQFAVVIFAAAISGCGAGSSSSSFTASSPLPATTSATPTSPTSSQSAVTFVLTGNMTTLRIGHTATLLPDGRVLIAGGEAPAVLGSASSGRSAELYDPATGTFAVTGSMTQTHSFHTATLLKNGKVLIADGTAAELYDSVTGSFVPTGGMLAPNKFVQAVLLASGKVLVTGDIDAELYDPANGTFRQAGKYAIKAGFYTSATLLAGGRVLLEGDNTTQIYDPTSDGFNLTASLSSAGLAGLELYSATLLTNGKVLIAGGTDEISRFATAVLYDPAMGSFKATASMSSMRDAHAAVLLADGRALIVGGDGMSCSGNVCAFSGSLAAAELYDPSTGSFTSAGNMNTGRTLPKATLLKNGDVLITGGDNYCGIGCFKGSLATAELYHPHL